MMDMKFLKIEALNATVFKNPFEISFLTSQQVEKDDPGALHNVCANAYLKPVSAFVGNNGSGKSLSLKLIALVLDLLSGKSINNLFYSELIKDKLKLTVYFSNRQANEIVKYELLIYKYLNVFNEVNYQISNEALFTKKASVVRSKKQLFDFDNAKALSLATSNDNSPQDVGAVANYLKAHQLKIVSKAFVHNNALLNFPVGEISYDILKLVDPNLERISIKEDCSVVIKFSNQNNPVHVTLDCLAKVLSNGVILGILYFDYAIKVLKHGGLLIIDDLDAHLNKELVKVLVSLFLQAKTNLFGASLIFTTHYLQGLDSLNRNDYVNILTKDDLGLFKLENLSSIISRTDLKKSEVINKTITNAGQLQEEQLLLEEYLINQVAPAGEPSNKTRD